MTPQPFRGSFTVCVTPFTADGGGIDLGAWRDFLDWQVASGAPGVIVLGTTGEFLTVSDEERSSLVHTAVETIGGRVPVLIGTMNASTSRAVTYSREAEALGASGLMILPPYYYTPTDDEIVCYYEAICNTVQLPIMLYNNPVTSNVDLSAALVARLVRSFDNIRYIKESSRDLARVRDVIEATGGQMQVFAGERALDSFLLGAVGYVNPFGNYAPRASIRLYELFRAGRIEQARQIQRVLDEIDHTIARGHPTYGHQCYSKRLAAAVGHPVGDVRPPLTTFPALGDEGRDRLFVLEKILGRLDDLLREIDSTQAA
jgi:4-hydroxy-tetrahydrodipicolinate synthase